MIKFLDFLTEASKQDAQGRINEEQWARSLSHYSAGRKAAMDDLGVSQASDLHEHWETIHQRGMDHMLRGGLYTTDEISKTHPSNKKAVADLGEEDASQVLKDTHSAAKTYIQWLHNRGEHFDGNVQVMGADASGAKAGEMMGRKGGKPDKSDIVAVAHDVKDHPDIFLKKQGFKTSKIDPETRDIFRIALEHSTGAGDHSDKINSILDKHGIDPEKRQETIDRIVNYQKKALQRYSGISAKYSATGSKDIKVSQQTTKDILDSAKADVNSESYKTLRDSKEFSSEIRQIIHDHPILGPAVRALHGDDPRKTPKEVFSQTRRANDFVEKNKAISPKLTKYAEELSSASGLKFGDIINSLSDMHNNVREKQQEHINRITDAMVDSMNDALQERKTKRWALIRSLAGQTPTRQEGGSVTNLVSIISKGKDQQPDTKVITLQRALDALQREHQKGGRYEGHDWWVDRKGMTMSIRHGIKDDPSTHRTVYSVTGDSAKAITDTGTGASMSVNIPSTSPIMDRNILLKKTKEPLSTHIKHPDEIADIGDHGGRSFYGPGEK